jgi:hypothetical protein
VEKGGRDIEKRSHNDEYINRRLKKEDFLVSVIYHMYEYI